jgi:hypothetical protein
MTFGAGIIRDVATIDEVTFGTTPASPAFTLMRVLEGSGMHATKVVDVINQLSAHGNPIDMVQLGQDAMGSYNLVPSYGGAFETMLLAAIRQSAFTANVAWNGRAPLTSKTFEEKIVGTATNYLRFTGVEVEQLDLDLTARQVAKATLSVQAKQMAVATSALASSTYAAVNTEEVLTGLTVSSIALLGLSPVPSITSLKLSVKHPLSPITVLGSLTRVGPSPYDRIAVTGSIDTVFEDRTAHDLFLNHASGALAMTLGTVTTKKYTINIPKVYFQEGAVSQAGSGPITATFGFTGVHDGTNGCIQITKAVA